jgi:hypothetical protein
MAKKVIATVKTDKQIIIDGVNREKLILGSASEVCERALSEYFEPQRKHEFSVNDVDEIRLSKILININTNDCGTLHLIANEKGLTMPDLCSIILSRFCRGEIRFYDIPEYAVIETITQETQTENKPFTTEIQTVNETVNQETESLYVDSDKVIITISELMIPAVQDILRKNGFEELRYYTPEKEHQVNREMNNLINDVKAEKQNEINRLQAENQTLNEASGDIEGLIEGTKICIKELSEIGINPFSRFDKKEILKVFPEKLRPIFEA